MSDFELAEGLLGVFIFLDIFTNITGTFGIGKMYDSLNLLIISSIFVALGLMFYITSGRGEVSKARTAARLCFLLALIFFIYNLLFERIVMQLGSIGVEGVQLSQFLLECGILSFALNKMFGRIYPGSRVTNLLWQFSIASVSSSILLGAGLVLYSL